MAALLIQCVARLEREDRALRGRGARIEDDLSGAALCDLVELARDDESPASASACRRPSLQAGLDTAGTRTGLVALDANGDFRPETLLAGACADGPRIPHHRRRERELGDGLAVRCLLRIGEVAAAAARTGRSERRLQREGGGAVWVCSEWLAGVRVAFCCGCVSDSSAVAGRVEWMSARRISLGKLARPARKPAVCPQSQWNQRRLQELREQRK